LVIGERTKADNGAHHKGENLGAPGIGYGPSRVWLKTGADNRWAKKGIHRAPSFSPYHDGFRHAPITFHQSLFTSTPSQRTPNP